MEVGLAVDPGVNKGNACALFSLSTGRLIRAEMVGDFTDYIINIHNHFNVRTLAIEIPVVRQTGKQRGRQRDIINLAIACGKVQGSFKDTCGGKIVEVFPEQWKGQLPKQVCCDRIYERLTDSEKKLIPKQKTYRNDLLDAVGIGLHVFDRERAIR